MKDRVEKTHANGVPKLEGSQPGVVLRIQARWPILMDEKSAAEYLSFSMSYLRNLRHSDGERLVNGLEPIGPVFTKVGRSVRYNRRDLDSWAEQLSEK